MTFNREDTSCLLRKEKRFYAFAPTDRNIINLIRNSFFAFKILRHEKPHVIITTGAGVGVPFIYVGKLLGIKTIYIESITRLKDLSLSGKLVYPVVDNLLVQWPELEKRYKKAVFAGQVI